MQPIVACIMTQLELTGWQKAVAGPFCVILWRAGSCVTNGCLGAWELGYFGQVVDHQGLFPTLQ
jgi:hypothetical protein